MFYGQEDSFFLPEVRNGWKISSTTKKVWAVQLDLIKQLLELCRENNLRCYAFFGTLLGVIRHKGYIPWDDDVDFAMPRRDYDKLLELCKTKLKEPYFLQTTVSDVESYEIHSSLRNSNTTGNCWFNMHKPCNNGIAIDIVPIDGVEDDFHAYKKRRRKIRFYSTLCNTFVNDVNKSFTARILRRCLRTLTPKFPYQKIYLKDEENLRRFDFDKSEKVSTVLIADNTAEELYWDRKDFDKIEYIDFENIKLPVPCGYDKILRITYGDYMEFPPLDKRGDKHEIEFDPDTPYREYCSEKYNVIYKEPPK